VQAQPADAERILVRKYMTEFVQKEIGGSGGRILSCCAGEPAAEYCIELPAPEPFEAWCACRRSESCWMTPVAGTRLGDVPQETQMLLLKSGDLYTVYLPLVAGEFRAALFSKNGALQVRVESGSPAVTGQAFDLVYINQSGNPYELLETAARDLQQELGTFKIADKAKRPEFMSVYGWCSWNAFYQDVSAEKIESVLENFKANGVCPGFVIMDAGWQQSSKWHLTGLGADTSKFPDGLGPAIQHIKSRFQVEHLFLWQTYNGFWCGLEPQQFPDARRADMEPPARLLSGQRAADDARFDTNSKNFYPEHVLDQGFWCPASFETFYDEYHRTSAAAGADGVKIDAITWIETCGKDYGGRVALMREFLSGAEQSARRYFNDQVIWCSSCSNDFLFNSNGEGVVRTSTDFFPDKPETHGLHIYANAINSFFMGAFVRPDWDMFQSALGVASEFHAASRAVSGGPVYSTDAFGKENFKLIKKLVLPDGTVPLCETHALPTLDSLFTDPQQSLIKIFNRNKTGHVLGIFNTAYDESGAAERSGSYAVADVVPLRNSTADFVMVRHSDQSAQRVNASDTFEITLPALGYELLTISEIRDGFAPIGDQGLFNSGGVIQGWDSHKEVQSVELKSCRKFCAFSERSPRQVMAEGVAVDFERDASMIRVNFPEAFTGTLTLVLDES
jgi:raffinose synthase